MKTTTIILSGILSLLVCDLRPQCNVNQVYMDTYMYTDGNFGQSFVPCADGQLTRVDFYMHHFLTGDIPAQFSLIEGEGMDGDVLFSKPMILNDTWGGIHSMDVEEELMVTTLMNYTIRLDFLGEFGTAWVRLTNIYDDGIFFWDGEAIPTMDLGFNVQITPIEPECMVWTGANGQDWTDPLNWTPNDIPDSTDCVIIPSLMNSNYPIIQDKAEALDLMVETDAHLYLLESARMDIYKGLEVFGQANLQGDLQMMNRNDLGSIVGGVTANRLKIFGTMVQFEPLTILDLLDLSEGYLLNFGSELIVMQGDEYKGHVYYPQSAYGGRIILRKHVNEGGDLLIAAPFYDHTRQSIKDSLGLQALVNLVDSEENEQFQIDWGEVEEYQEPHQPIDAYRMEVQAGGYITLDGSVNTEDHIVSGSSDSGASGDWKFLGNPYPSIIDWSRVEKSEGTSPALYMWNEDEGQFAVKIGGLDLFEGHNRIDPMDGFFIRIPEGHQIDISYEESAITPAELYDEEEYEMNTVPLMELQVQTSHGRDRTIVAYGQDATSDIDIEQDAYKIPSLDGAAPTFGSIAPNGQVLSVNCTEQEATMGIIPLYFDSEVTGMIQFTPLLIENFDAGDNIFLEDRKLSVFHDLFSNGVYSTNWTEEDLNTRFFLHLNWTEEMTTDEQLAPSSPQSQQEQGTNAPDHLVESFHDVITIQDSDGDLDPFTDIQVISMNGQLVFSDKTTDELGTYSATLHCSPGFYLVIVQEGERQTIDKVWIN